MDTVVDTVELFDLGDVVTETHFVGTKGFTDGGLAPLTRTHN